MEIIIARRRTEPRHNKFKVGDIVKVVLSNEVFDLSNERVEYIELEIVECRWSSYFEDNIYSYRFVLGSEFTFYTTEKDLLRNWFREE